MSRPNEKASVEAQARLEALKTIADKQPLGWLWVRDLLAHIDSQSALLAEKKAELKLAISSHGVVTEAYRRAETGRVALEKELQALRNERPDSVTIEVRQQDWMPGFAAYVHACGGDPSDHKLVVLNIGGLLSCIQQGDLTSSELADVVTDCLVHEVGHVIEGWAGAEFSEERVEGMAENYREAAQLLATPDSLSTEEESED